MNEHELKSALQDVLVASSPPPPMDPRAALEQGRRAHRRRRATWGGAAAGLAVVAIAVGAVLVPNLPGGGAARVGAQPSGPAAGEPPSVTPTAPTSPVAPDERLGGVKWPDGQTDRTATSGPRADKGAKLLDDLASALPAGVAAEDRTRITHLDHGPMTVRQAQFVDRVDGVEVWEYLVITPIVRAGDSGVGRLFVEIETKGNTRLGDRVGCEAATRYPYPVEGGVCELVDVEGRQVAVVDGATAGGNSSETAAFYRHPDGTRVTVSHAPGYQDTGHPALTAPALTARQLAELAVDPRFHLD